MIEVLSKKEESLIYLGLQLTTWFLRERNSSVSYEVLMVPTANSSLIANPLAKVPQSVFQVAAVSTEDQAQKLASQIRSVIPREQASVRVESNGSGLFRVQVLPKRDLSVESAIYEKLVMLGWSPQKSIMK